MKLLILTVSAGEGHNSMSRAISNYIKDTYPDTEIKQIDLFKDGDKTKRKKQASWMVNEGYFTLVKIATKLANRQFEKLKNRDITRPATTLRKNFITPATPYVEKVVNEYQPDAVFCAHTFAGIIMTDLRNKGNENALKAKVVTIVSDYDIAPYTELLTKVDYIVTPSEDFDNDLLKKGFDLSKRLALGIPVQTKCSKFIDIWKETVKEWDKKNLDKLKYYESLIEDKESLLETTKKLFEIAVKENESNWDIVSALNNYLKSLIENKKYDYAWQLISKYMNNIKNIQDDKFYNINLGRYIIERAADIMININNEKLEKEIWSFISEPFTEEHHSFYLKLYEKVLLCCDIVRGEKLKNKISEEYQKELKKLKLY